MTRNSDVNSMLGLFLGVSARLGPVILHLSYFALREFQKSCNDAICLLSPASKASATTVLLV